MLGDAFEVVGEAWDALAPVERMALSQYAQRHRLLTKGFGGEARPFDGDRAPYLAGPSDALSSGDFTTVVVPGPGQCAKTTIAENWLQMSVESDPADFLWYMHTDSGMQGFVKDRIDPMIQAHEGMRDRIGREAVDNSLRFKNFGRMRAEFLSFNPGNLINKNAPRIVVDEVDNFDLSEMGEPKPVLDVRRQVYGSDSCMLLMSHPDLATGMRPSGWKRGIMGVYAGSTRGTWWWPCPSCNGFSSPNPGTARHMALDYPSEGSIAEIAAAARLVCPCCGALLEDRKRRLMNADGRWVHAGEMMEVDGTVTGRPDANATAGFWIVGAMSPFVLGGIHGLVEARVKAERGLETDGGESGVRQVMVKQWGFPHVPNRKVGSVDSDVIADRCEDGWAWGRVPEGVRFITCSADVQANRFEWIRRGWGVGGESWVLERGRMDAETATDPDCWDALLARLQEALPLGDGSARGMVPRAVSMDLGGSAGVTARVYEAWLRWRRAGLVRMYGVLDQREAWSVIPTQGAPSRNSPRLVVVKPDAVRSDRAASGASLGQVPVARFNPNLFKDDLAGQIEKAEPGPWYVHFHRALRSAEPPHTWFAQLTAEHRRSDGTWAKTIAAAPNEAGDLMVMTHVLARLHGVGRLNWDNPPAWAAPWDANSSVVALNGVAMAVERPVPVAPAPRAAPVPRSGGGSSYFKRPAGRYLRG